jgi:hypothetical protein
MPPLTAKQKASCHHKQAKHGEPVNMSPFDDIAIAADPNYRDVLNKDAPDFDVESPDIQDIQMDSTACILSPVCLYDQH